MVLKQNGLGEWGCERTDLHNHKRPKQLLRELEETLPLNAQKHRVDVCINGAIFSQRALQVFDDRCAKGLVA